jgi:Zn-dependent protease with chaperone function
MIGPGSARFARHDPDSNRILPSLDFDMMTGLFLCFVAIGIALGALAFGHIGIFLTIAGIVVGTLFLALTGIAGTVARASESENDRA